MTNKPAAIAAGYRGMTMACALGYLLTWTTCGTWLPGDRRGWVNRSRTHGEVVEPPAAPLEVFARQSLVESSFKMDRGMRQLVDEAIRAACLRRNVQLWALGVRSNHVHAVVTAPAFGPMDLIGLLKTYATYALRSLVPRKHYWTRYGSTRYLNNQASLDGAIRYVVNQDSSWNKQP
jgi:REP element-mobilizing transposase RayT